MELTGVVNEIRAALDTIAGLRVPAWGIQSITPPAALVLPPERIDYDDTYGRGKDRYPDLEVAILVGNPTTWQAMKELAPYANGSGAKSVKAVVEAYAFTTCDPASVRVAYAEFEVATYAGTPYLAAIFHIELTGTGA
jgi:hypothetical protein